MHGDGGDREGAARKGEFLSQPALLDMCSVLQVSCKQLFLPAGNDGPEVKEGGIADEILKENLEVRRYKGLSCCPIWLV